MAGPATAERISVKPFINVSQFATDQLSGSNGTTDSDFVTYTEVSGGLIGTANTRRVSGTVNYTYTRRIAEAGDSVNDSSHNGIARARLQLVPDLLALDGGAIATYSRVNPGLTASQLDIGTSKNVAQVFGYYVSPTLNKVSGDFTFNATYRYGFTTAQTPNGGALGMFDQFDKSRTHEASAQVGMKDSNLPFNWTLTSSYTHENTTQRDQHYRALSTVGEVVVPVFDTVAVVASGGYEKLESTEQASLLDANGLPIVGSDGRFVPDTSAPRVLTYDVSGLIADAGLIWAPSRRTHFEARAGYRYDGFTTSGLFEMRPDDKTALTLIVFDRIDSFGRGVTNGLGNVPLSFQTDEDGSSAATYQNCVFGKQPGTGSCLGGTLGSSSSSLYRSRGATFFYGYTMRQSRLNFSAGYQRRTYIDDPSVPNSLDGTTSQSVFVQGDWARNLTVSSGLGFSLSGNLAMNGQVGISDVASVAIDSRYYRTFGRSLRAQATVGIEAEKQDGVPADVSGRAQLGLRYQF